MNESSLQAGHFFSFGDLMQLGTIFPSFFFVPACSYPSQQGSFLVFLAMITLFLGQQPLGFFVLAEDCQASFSSLFWKSQQDIFDDILNCKSAYPDLQRKT